MQTYFHKKNRREEKLAKELYNSRKEREIGEALTTWHKEEEEEKMKKTAKKMKGKKDQQNFTSKQNKKKSKGKLKRKIIHSERTWKSHNWRTIFGTIWRLSGWSSKTAQGVYSKGS